MSALPLAEVTDYSTIIVGPTGAISFDLTPAVIKGPAAILERVLRSWLGPVVWAPDKGFDITSLENGDWMPNDVASFRKALTDAAMSVDYVLTATVAVELVRRELSAKASITLIDGRTYALEVPISQIAAAVLAQAKAAA